MPEQRRLYQLKHSLVVAVPPTIRAQLLLVRGQPVWWHLPWKGEAVLTTTPTRADGYPDRLTLHDELVAARAEVIRLRRRVAALELSLYAEGYALGRADGATILLEPHGRRARQLGRRRRAFEMSRPEELPAPAPVDSTAPLGPVTSREQGSAEGETDRS